MDEKETAGINDRLQLAELERHFQMREATRLMKSGVTLRDPARFDLRGSVRCGKDVIIDINVILEGNVELGDNVRIGPNCTLKNIKFTSKLSLISSSILFNPFLSIFNSFKFAIQLSFKSTI